jgi:hypothetical protein
MPWPWSIAVACLDMSTGQILNWPIPQGGFVDNEFILEACWRIWRVVHLHQKPRTRGSGKNMKNNWTPSDVDLFAWLTDNAGYGWTLHLEEGENGQPA